MGRKQITISRLIGVKNQEELIEGCQKLFKISVPKVYCEVIFFLPHRHHLHEQHHIFPKALFLKHEASMSKYVCVMKGLSFTFGHILVRQMQSMGKLNTETGDTGI